MPTSAQQRTLRHSAALPSLRSPDKFPYSERYATAIVLGETQFVSLSLMVTDATLHLESCRVGPENTDPNSLRRFVDHGYRPAPHFHGAWCWMDHACKGMHECPRQLPDAVAEGKSPSTCNQARQGRASFTANDLPPGGVN
ncbi:hypothetical protein ON010_g16993 [Phytophthora cinnamomi]|nr:hypothetical protein ON010_g16993 [Phytophthora cinnamomi]